MRFLIGLAVMVVALSVVTLVSAHKPGWCGHGEKQWVEGSTVYGITFNYHTNAEGNYKPTGNYHHVTVWVWNETSRVWIKVHSHVRKCH